MKNFFQQGEIADEAARVCLDSGDLDAAQTWYRIGHDTGLKESDIKPARQDCGIFGGSTRRLASPPGEANKPKRKSMLRLRKRSLTGAPTPNKLRSCPT